MIPSTTQQPLAQGIADLLAPVAHEINVLAARKGAVRRVHPTRTDSRARRLILAAESYERRLAQHEAQEQRRQRSRAATLELAAEEHEEREAAKQARIDRFEARRRAQLNAAAEALETSVAKQEVDRQSRSSMSVASRRQRPRPSSTTPNPNRSRGLHHPSVADHRLLTRQATTAVIEDDPEPSTTKVRGPPSLDELRPLVAALEQQEAVNRQRPSSRASTGVNGTRHSDNNTTNSVRHATSSANAGGERLDREEEDAADGGRGRRRHRFRFMDGGQRVGMSFDERERAYRAAAAARELKVSRVREDIEMDRAEAIKERHDHVAAVASRTEERRATAQERRLFLATRVPGLW